jgi:hypothetical protein
MINFFSFRKNRYIYYASFFAWLLIGGLMAPGYILTLDMVFGPVTSPFSLGNMNNILPIIFINRVLLLFLEGWLVQKFIIFIIFILSFYLTLRFFKEIFKLESTYGTEYLAALMFVINPFVYERMLSGQWLVVAGYMMLVPALAYTLGFVRDSSFRNVYSLAMCLSVLAIVSLHYFTVVMVLVVPFLLTRWLIVFDKFSYFKQGVLLAGLLLLLNSYWLVPAVLNHQETQLSTFTPSHYEVFKTVNDERLGTVGNVLIMHGFWLERESWIERFLLAKKQGWQFWTSFTLLILLVAVGVYGIEG